MNAIGQADSALPNRIVVGIYAIRNTLDGKVYVGSSTDVRKRWGQHKAQIRSGRHHNAHLRHACAKHGLEAFAFTLLEECAFEVLAEREGAHMARLQSCDRQYGYNLDPIIQGRTVQSQESRDKKSLARIGFKPTAETVARGAATRRSNGIPRSAEAIAKSTAYNQGRKQDPEHTAKIAKALQGHVVTAETRAKASATKLAQWNDPEIRARRVEARRKREVGREEAKALVAAAARERKNAKRRKRPDPGPEGAA